MATVKKILFWVLVGFVLIQFIPIDKTNVAVKSSVNFVDVKNTTKNQSTY
jgi:hypothetical protein